MTFSNVESPLSGQGGVERVDISCRLVDKRDKEEEEKYYKSFQSKRKLYKKKKSKKRFRHKNLKRTSGIKKIK